MGRFLLYAFVLSEVTSSPIQSYPCLHASSKVQLDGPSFLQKARVYYDFSIDSLFSVTVCKQSHKFKDLTIIRKISIKEFLEVNSLKCGLCKGEVKEQSKITDDGKCSNCGAKLAVAK